jgi:ERCC4-type nuclease
MEGEAEMILVNANEPASYRKLAEKVVKPEEIRIDFIVTGANKSFAIERKDVVSDLRASLLDGRLWEQCAILKQLQEQDYTVAIVLVGELWKAFRFGKMTMGQWIGIQVGIASWGIPVIFVSSKEQFKYLLDTMNEKAGKATKFVAPVIKSKDRTIKEERIDMLRQIAGVGEVTATALVDRYRTIANVCLGIDEAWAVNFLGKKYKHVKEVLNGPDVEEVKEDEKKVE